MTRDSLISSLDISSSILSLPLFSISTSTSRSGEVYMWTARSFIPHILHSTIIHTHTWTIKSICMYIYSEHTASRFSVLSKRGIGSAQVTDRSSIVMVTPLLCIETYEHLALTVKPPPKKYVGHRIWTDVTTENYNLLSIKHNFVLE